ncbi:MAG TPA: 4-hydroxy-tetrahydrodipicolinate reductase [Firmicutes bacterium]|jgi:4-hydroxy-tetrahydrodipicolinate reductase|nr:4-hydroxy-tetrahydrodipicolinate reductase [Bacillota bacterium]
MEKIKVAVSGAYGRMGREVCNAILDEEDLELVAAFDLCGEHEDIGEMLGKKPLGISIDRLTRSSLEKAQPGVIVDFTTPMAVINNIELALQCGVRPVVGTTGITQVDLSRIEQQVESSGLSAIIAPNFALGAVLMMKFASIAARYFPQAEIIELHHDQKIDAPSGTALKTANIIIDSREEDPPEKEELIKLTGARGAVQDKIHIHSVRLSGLVAHQEVIFGGVGQTLTIRHDSIDRKSFMPGVIFAVKKAVTMKGLVYGLENLLEW